MLKWSSIILFSICIVSVQGQILAQSQIKVSNLKKHIRFLADDKLKGRAPGSEGDILAENYIINCFEQYNLLPYGDKMDKIVMIK